MSKTRNLSDLLDANGDVKSTALDNVPASDLVNDTTPQLGGNLDINSNDITGTGNIDVTGTIEFGDGHQLGNETTYDNLVVKSSTDENMVLSTGGTGQLIVKTGSTTLDNGSEKFRIDNSGNVLVGKTSSSGSVAGAELRAGGRIFGTASATTPLFLNRLTSDGDVITLRKDGAEFGTIGNTGTTLKINGVSSGIYVGGSVAVIYPQSDNTHDLGTTSLRFNDGNFGGTVTANAFSGDGSALTNLPASTPSDGSITFAKLSGSSTESINVQKRIAKVWVNFNANSDAIRQDYNVSSITNVTTGRNRINFTSSLADTNYCCSGMAQVSSNDGGVCIVSYTSDYHGSAVATSSVRVDTTTAENSSNDAPICCVTIMR